MYNFIFYTFIQNNFQSWINCLLINEFLILNNYKNLPIFLWMWLCLPNRLLKKYSHSLQCDEEENKHEEVDKDDEDNKDEYNKDYKQ